MKNFFKRIGLMGQRGNTSIYAGIVVAAVLVVGVITLAIPAFYESSDQIMIAKLESHGYTILGIDEYNNLVAGHNTIEEKEDLIIEAISASMALAGTPYYVSTPANGGADSNDGLTWATSMATIDAAYSLCDPNVGDGILIGPGIFDETANGASGIIADIEGVSIIDIGRPLVKNSDTTSPSTTLTITANIQTIRDVAFSKGETTSTDSVVVLIDGAFGAILIDCGFTLEKEGFTGIKLTGGASRCSIKSDGTNRNTFRPQVGNLGVGVDFDNATFSTVEDGDMAQLTVGVCFCGGSSGNTVSNMNITNCTTGVVLEEGSANNSIVANFANCTLDIDDDSRNSTNVTDVHHEHVYPASDGEGGAGDPLVFSSDTSDDTHGVATTQYYWGDIGILIPINTLTSKWALEGFYIYIATANKFLQWQAMKIDPAYSTAQDGGNAWDEGETALTVTDATLFEVDDLVWIVSDEETDGEILVVTDVTGSVVTIERETSQFGVPNTGVRFTHTTNAVMYLSAREAGDWHTMDGDFSGASSKEFARIGFHQHLLLPGNAGLIGRMLNQTDSTTATAEAKIIYDD